MAPSAGVCGRMTANSSRRSGRRCPSRGRSWRWLLHRAQHLVAQHVAELVVDGLEGVQVEHGERQRSPCRSARCISCFRRHQVAAVVQAGERVAHPICSSVICSLRILSCACFVRSSALARARNSAGSQGCDVVVRAELQAADALGRVARVEATRTGTNPARSTSAAAGARARPCRAGCGPAPPGRGVRGEIVQRRRAAAGLDHRHARLREQRALERSQPARLAPRNPSRSVMTSPSGSACRL